MPLQQKKLFSLIALLLSFLLLFSGCSTTDKAHFEKYGSVAKGERFKRQHIVRKGETLYSIAWRANLDYLELAKWNGVTGPGYHIVPGQKLRFKPPKYPIKTTKKVTKAKQNSIEAPKTERSIKQKPVVSLKQLKLHWKWPTLGSVVRKYSKTDHRRQGIRISGREGQRITAAESGKVVYSGNGLIGYGNLVIIKHDSIYLSAYAHNRRIFVKEGMKVSKGSLISEMGIAPDSKKAALHFEIRKNGKPVDPQVFLPKSR
jgi:lipoprotein NlpD